MQRAVTLLSLALLACALPARGHAQTLPLAEGDRIRIDSPLAPGRDVDARLVRVEPEWIGFSLAGDSLLWTRRLEFVDQVALRVARPSGSRALRAARWGVFLGTSVGAMSAPFIAFGTDAEVRDWSAVGMGAGAGALVGAGLGALWGVIRPSHRWVEYQMVPTP